MSLLFQTGLGVKLNFPRVVLGEFGERKPPVSFPTTLPHSEMD